MIISVEHTLSFLYQRSIKVVVDLCTIDFSNNRIVASVVLGGNSFALS